ncbi:MAG: methylisocitrate lyase [Fimbriimonadaceae bacterium]|nr:methylisocitrate lyase [Fimbriimonadaceae bacterium]
MLRPAIPSPGAVLRERIRRGPVMLPGVFNGISARSAADAGAEALYMSGAGVTNALLGVPDIALAGLDEFARQAAAITQVVRVPVIADADTGFGEAWNTYRTVLEMERAGLAGIHLEDQVSPKRCGHLDGKAVIPTEQMVDKIAAAVGAKRDPSFVIIARTDARGVEGLDAAIARARAYVAAGADAVFPEGLASAAEFERFRAEVSVPLLANMTEFGKTPILPFAEFAAMGFEMVIYPMTAFRVMLRALDEAYGELLAKGSQAGLLDRMRTRAELYARLEYPRYESSEFRDN